MIQVCAYCLSVIGINFKVNVDMLSHGICRDCQPGFLRQSGIPEKEIEEFMNE